MQYLHDADHPHWKLDFSQSRLDLIERTAATISTLCTRISIAFADMLFFTLFFRAELSRPA